MKSPTREFALHTNSFLRFLALSLVGSAAVAGTAPRLSAQTYTWNNFAGTTGGGNLLWSTAANWDVALPVPPAIADSIVFTSSGFQTSNNYQSTVDANYVVNQLTFALEGNAQGISNGLPMILNIGESTTARSLTLNTSITQNGSGAVTFLSNVASSSIVLGGSAPLAIGGTGIGLLQINANLVVSESLTNGILVNFNPSAVRANNTGASVVLAGTNTFLGDVVLQNGNLDIASNTALGAAANKLIVNAGQNSVRINNNPVIPNNIVLNSTMTVTSYDGSGTATAFTGTWSGTGGLTFRNGVGSTYAIRGAAGFSGPLNIQPLTLGLAGTANNLALTVGSTVGGGSIGSLATTDIQLFAGSFLTLNNANGNATRLAAGTNLTMLRSSFSLTANATAGSNAAESVATVTNTGMSTIIVRPGTLTSSTLTFGSWNRLSNSTAYFVGNGLGGTPGANVGNVVFTANPGGASPGSTTPGTQNLAVLPYAYASTITNPATADPDFAATPAVAASLVRYDAGTGRIVPLNATTEYAGNQTMAYGTGAAGVNYRLAGAGTGGVARLSGAVSLNGLVLDTNMATPPPVGVALVGNSTLNLSGPVLSTFSGTGFPTGITTFLPNQIAVSGLAFGANAAYFHTPGDLWVSSPITGSGGLVKSGENGSGQANLYLLGNNPFTGGLTINAGGVFFTNDANLGAAGGSILMNSGGNGGLFFTQNPNYDSAPAANPTISRPLTLGAANGSIGTIVSNNTLTYSGPITGAGGLVVQSVGVVALTNVANSFSGDVMLRSGTVIAAGDGVFGAAGNRILLGVPQGQAVFQPGAGYTATNRDFLLLNSGNTIFTNGIDFTINGAVVSTQTNFAGPGITKGGLGTLTLTAANTLGGPVTVGDTGLRISAPSATQLGGALKLAGPNGALPLASAFTVNDGASLILDNSTGVNADRIGTVNVGLGGGSLALIGNATANATESVGAISTNTAGTITLSQPASAGGQVTTLSANGFGTSNGGTLFVRGTNLGAVSGDRTQLLVAPANTTTAMTLANGIVVGGFAAASDAAAGPTDLLAATVVTPAVSPNVNRYSLVPLATYGSLAAPSVAVNADQSGSVFTLTGATPLNALRIGAGGGLDLSTFALTLGTATANAQAGTILAAGGANAGIINGTLDFGSQTVRIVTTNDLSIGTAANPTAILGNSSGFFVKTGPGTLTLFGTAATTLATTGTASGQVYVGEGTLVLGNATALGRSTLNSTSVAPIPNVFPSVQILKGATLDLSPLAAAPIRINTIVNSGTLALGDATVNTGLSSSNIQGNITGSANSKFIVGLPQTDIPLNTFGGGGPTLTGDNSGFLGQWQVLRGSINFTSNLSFGTGTSPILLGDSGLTNPTGSTSIGITSTLTVPFPRDIVVQASPVGVPTLRVGNASNLSMTGNLTLNKALGVSGDVGSAGMFTFAGTITGPGQLQLGTSVFGGSGNVAFAGANPAWTGGILMNTGQSNSGISSIVAVGADNSLGTGTLTLGQFAGLLRADNGARTLTNAINVADTAPTAAFTTSFGSTGVNDLTLTGDVRGTMSSIPAALTTLTLNLNSISRGTTTYAGTISNGAVYNLGLTKNGPGFVAFNGNNTFTGDSVVNAGTVQLGNANALGFGGRQAMTAVNGAATVNSGAILDLNGQVAVNKPLTLSGGSLLNNSASPASVAGGTISSLTLTASGGAFSAVPTVTISGGGGSGATAVASLGLSQASLTFVPLSTGGSAYSTPPTVTIAGGGGTGATAVATLGVTAATYTILNGGSGYVTAPTVTLGGGGGSGATATSTIVGGVVTSITITAPGNNFSFPPSITFGAAPTGGTTATGIGNAANFTVGAITLTNPGGGYATAPTLSFSGGGGGGTSATANATNFALGLIVTNPGSGYTSTPAVGFSVGTATAAANRSFLTLAANSFVGGTGPLAIDAPITGAFSLTKVGTGTTTLSNNNTYSGGTTVLAGTLNVTNTTGSGTGTSAVTVAAGATLQGTGIIGSNVIVNGGTIKGGSSPGTLTISSGSLDLNASSTFQIDLRTSGSFTVGPVNGGASGTGGSDNSRVTVSNGAINFNNLGSLVVKLSGDASLFTADQQYSFLVGSGTGVTGFAAPITGTGAAPGQFDTTGLSGVLANAQFSLDVQGNSIYFNFTPTPEPTSILALAAAAAGGFLGLRRRFSRRKAHA